jgi:hypothetical protein
MFRPVAVIPVIPVPSPINDHVNEPVILVEVKGVVDVIT